MFCRIHHLKAEARADPRYRQVLVIPTKRELSPDIHKLRLWSFGSGNVPEWYRLHELDSSLIEIHTDEYIYRSTKEEGDEPILDALPHLDVDRKATRDRLEYFARLAIRYFTTATGDRRTRGSVIEVHKYIEEQSSNSASEASCLAPLY